MRKDSERLLAELTASYPKRRLAALWTDLRKLTKEEFEKLVGDVPTAAPAARTRRGAAASDTPASRITKILIERCAFQPSGAGEALKGQLVSQGIAPNKIPALRGSDFGAWLVTLFRTVPASQVLHAALEIAKKAARKS